MGSSSETDPLGLADELYAELGRAITRWAHAETLAGELLSFLVGGDPGLMYVITQSAAGASISKWVSVLTQIRFSNENTKTIIKSVLTELDDVRAERNAYVHGLWSEGPEPLTAMVRTVRWDRNEVIKDELVTMGDLKRLSERATQTHEEIRLILVELGVRKPLPFDLQSR